MILYLKDGSKIHIKKKNRGKFTSYCGGNVTSACIAKAKASGNPTLVKRATFAANARKWKHQNGGVFKSSNLSEGQQFAAEFPFLYALGKAVDPTGISGYSDVRKADKKWESNPSFSNGYNVAMETLGALPIISTGSRIWKVLQGFVTGNGFIKDYKEASKLSDQYDNELVIDYFDNTVKPRKEFENHRHHVSYTDANHLPSPELAPKGSKVGHVITNYDYKYKDHYNYKKYVKHQKGGKLCLVPRKS